MSDAVSAEREAVPWFEDEERYRAVMETGKPTMQAWVARVCRGDAPLSDQETLQLVEKVLHGTPDERAEARWILFPYEEAAP